MAVIKKSNHVNKTVSQNPVQAKKAELAVERAAREEEVKARLEKAELRRMKRNKQLKHQAHVEAKKLKAARHIIAINMPRDPVPDPKPKKSSKWRHKKKIAAQDNAIEMMNLLLRLQPKETVPGASKQKPAKCQKCEKDLIGLPKRPFVVYRQMVKRRFTPPVHLKKMKRMGLSLTSADVLSSNNYANRVNLATKWYHLSCLSEGQRKHIQEKGVQFSESIDDELKCKIQAKFKFEKEIETSAGDEVDIEEEEEEDGSGEEDLDEGSSGAAVPA